MSWKNSSTVSLRRSKLIAPFGVGAIVPGQDGLSVICASLDRWYQDASNEEEFKLRDDRRLIRRVRVDHLRLPPDHRDTSEADLNAGLTVPAYRFPRWHRCPKCMTITQTGAHRRGRVECPECKKKDGRTPSMYQVRFVAACDHGHLQDFPWREWVHHSTAPSCKGTLKLTSAGGGSLASMRVRCSCGASRSLGGITTGESGGSTFLTSNLSKDEKFLCRGHQPWMGEDYRVECNRPLRGSLKNASNLYFADTVSSIFIPAGYSRRVEDISTFIADDETMMMVRMLLKNPDMPLDQEFRDTVRRKLPPEFSDSPDELLEKAFELYRSTANEEAEDDPAEPEDQIEYRRREFDELHNAQAGSKLRVTVSGLEEYNEFIQECFSLVSLVDQLQETRVFRGFTRLSPGGGENQPTGTRTAQLWRRQNQRWLPASVVKGEGIFLALSEEKLSMWEQQSALSDRIRDLKQRFTFSYRYTEDTIISPRFVLVHTLSHLLINQLVYECGYSSAALRERLYVSDSEEAPMAGVLIYTASGDSDGTMGGLVRMGRPGFLGPMLRRAIDSAQWCSADPVCMEAGSEGGQGPESLNLAACHNCALVPETSCEEFNRFLDRGVIIGTRDDQIAGYFSTEGSDNQDHDR